MTKQSSTVSPGLGDMSGDMFHQQINAPRESYTIERCWRRPATERVSALVNITDVANAGTIIGNLLNGHGAECQVGLVAFPYGLQSCDGVRLEVHMIVKG